MARALVAGKNYELSVYKNPKVGKNPPVWYYGEEVPKDRRWSPLPLVVARYQEFSPVVDGANQMALHMRQLGKQTTWSHVVRAFIVRYTARNAFATATASRLVDATTTIWEFQ